MTIRFGLGFKKQYRKARRFAILRDHQLKGKYGGFRSIDITGDWRAIYEEVGNDVVFVALGTHSQLYG